MPKLDHGVLVISLDFELYWGVRDCCQITDYQANLLGVHQAIPGMLEVFSRAGIHATWATVGLLFCQDRDGALSASPARQPNYALPNLSPYRYMDSQQDLAPAYHFAPELVAAIAQTPGQELASHTFSGEFKK